MLRSAFAVALAWSAPSDGRPVPLSWEAPAECPDEGAVRERARALLAASDVDVGETPVRASARVHAIAGGYALDLHLDGGDRVGDRHLEATECAELAHAAALIVAIAIDTSAGTGTPEPEDVERLPPTQPMQPTQPTSAVEATRASVDEDTAAPRVIPVDPSGADHHTNRRRLPRFALRGGAGVDVGLWRPVGASVAFGAALVGRGYRIELTGRYGAPSIRRARDNRAIGASAQQWAIGVAGCYAPDFDRAPRLELTLCAGFEAGRIHARGTGSAVDARSDRAPWLAGSFGPGLAWRLSSSIAVGLSAEAVVLLGVPRFVTDRGTEVFQPNRAGFRTLAGLEARFGIERR